MTIPLVTRDVFALEAFTSIDYFGRMRDSFSACVKAVDAALNIFMRNLPDNYRAQHVSMQPDAVWGELVLPNMQWALEGLNEGYILLSHGNIDALGQAGNVETTFAGISREFTWAWMDSENYAAFEAQWTIAGSAASNIEFTVLGQWLRGELTGLRELEEPADWPKYRIDPSVKVRTGERVVRSGVYLPDLDGGCAQFLISGHEAWPASIPDPLSDPRITSAATKEFDTTWTLVERVADSGGTPSDFEDPVAVGVSLRCEAGQPCPRAGWWLTPSRQGSRRKFNPGDIMPDSRSDYGLTIWQWDANQSD